MEWDRAVIAAESIDDEDRVIGLCLCSRRWPRVRETVLPIDGRWLDLLVVECPECGARGGFAFDITTFFVPRPGVWGRRLGGDPLGTGRVAQMRLIGPKRESLSRAVA